MTTPRKMPRLIVDESDSAVARVYERVREMAISFELRPGDRLNELAIAKKLGVSRTPLREALNRLAGDGFLTFSPKQGFYRKPLLVQEIVDLYEIREQLERVSVRLAIKRASGEALAGLEGALLDPAIAQEKTDSEILSFDELFHERIAELSGNAELLSTLRNINSRIRYVRWINMEGRRQHTQGQHRAILDALRGRDAEACEALIGSHIALRQDQIVVAVKNAFARIYMGEPSPGPEG
jgi:DNA-binding GntR family transcriptional regulator